MLNPARFSIKTLNDDCLIFPYPDSTAEILFSVCLIVSYPHAASIRTICSSVICNRAKSAKNARARCVARCASHDFSDMNEIFLWASQAIGPRNALLSANLHSAFDSAMIGCCLAPSARKPEKLLWNFRRDECDSPEKHVILMIFTVQIDSPRNQRAT